MANEIRALAGDGNEGQRVLFLFPITAPQLKTYQDAANAQRNVVPTPQSTLPSDVSSGGFLTASELAQLDAGTLAFRVVTFTRTPDMDTNAKLAIRAKAIYAEELIAFNAWYTSSYRYVGSKVSYP
jgi:hypothetical protein